jgi:citronellol/citronellal dehydrogenase
MTKSLAGKVIFITGGSRGIGREIALRAAQDGANLIIAAKTAEAHPTLEGTIYTVAKEIELAGGQALPLQVDVRNEEQVLAAVEKAVKTFGKIDCLVNNASAITLQSTLNLPMKKFDLLFQVNMRATYLCSKTCAPYLAKSENPHILTLSPPLHMDAKWFKNHLAYTMSKYGMSMCTLGMAEEFRQQGIAVNSLWPKTLIATAAIAVNLPKAYYEGTRKPSIVADAAYSILSSSSSEVTGQFFIDEDVLRSKGISDFSHYSLRPGANLIPDLYLDT